MVIDLGKGSLFSPSGLEQDTGLLKERWSQTGSTLKNFTKDIASTGSVYTVTSGKRLYVSSIIISSGSTGSGDVRDTAGGTVRAYWTLVAAVPTTTMVFNPPIYFDTEMHYNEIGASTGRMTVTGWEESLR